MKRRTKRISPGRIIALGFLAVILAGTLLLCLPPAHSGRVRVTPLDALFTSVSAVCVTGLVTVDTGAAYSFFGQAVIAAMMQIGGLGITSLGAGLIALLGGRLNQRENNLVKEALNAPTWAGVGPLIRAVVLMDFSIEAAGALFSFFAFIGRYPLPRAAWLAVFHSIAAFNNGGFDAFGTGDSAEAFAGDVYFNLVTCALILIGGLGFFVIRELMHRRKGERLSLHTKVVLRMTLLLTLGGTLVFKLTEGASLPWLGAFFSSVTARTAGFSTYPMSGFSNAGILVMCALMFIGANPGSTGGGMKTTTVFVFLRSLRASASGREAAAFGRKLKDETMHRAAVIIGLGFGWGLFMTVLVAAFEPGMQLRDVLFEVFSALGTTGLSTGITASLSVPAKLLIMLTMYVGRLGPLSAAALLAEKKPAAVSRAEEEIPIG